MASVNQRLVLRMVHYSLPHKAGTVCDDFLHLASQSITNESERTLWHGKPAPKFKVLPTKAALRVPLANYGVILLTPIWLMTPDLQFGISDGLFRHEKALYQCMIWYDSLNLLRSSPWYLYNDCQSFSWQGDDGGCQLPHSQRSTISLTSLLFL